MANSIYAVKEGERCPRCGYRRNEYPHFRTCVPRQKWPHSMADPERKPRVVVNGKVYDADKVPALTFPQAVDRLIEQSRDRTRVVIDAYMQEHPQAVSGEASSPASVALAEVDDAGANQSPEAAPVSVGAWEGTCECGYVAKSEHGMKIHMGKAHKES